MFCAKSLNISLVLTPYIFNFWMLIPEEVYGEEEVKGHKDYIWNDV